MKLTYRGVSYERKASILEVCEGEIGGVYRGQEWHECYPRHIPQLKPKLLRQYRGVAYSTLPIPDSVSIEHSESMGKVCPVSAKKLAKVYLDETSQTHLDNIRRSLERRLEVAKTNGDDYLVNMLEQESKQLALK
jgi:hypothetical protein